MGQNDGNTSVFVIVLINMSELISMFYPERINLHFNEEKIIDYAFGSYITRIR